MKITLQDQTRNADIRKRTQKKKKKEKKRMGGHVFGLDHNRWAHAAAIWDPWSDLTIPSTPATQWTEDMKKVATRNPWIRTVRDSDEWKKSIN